MTENHTIDWKGATFINKGPKTYTRQTKGSHLDQKDSDTNERRLGQLRATICVR